MREVHYQTPHGIDVSRITSKLPYRQGFGRFLRELDRYRGIYLSSGYEYPGRYSRWDIVSVRPPLELVSFQREVTFRPLNERGAAINRMLATVLRDHPHWDDFREENGTLHGTLKPMPKLFPEEERSKQPSVFSILRALTRGIPQRARRQTGLRRRVRLRSAVSVRADPAAAAARQPQRPAALPLRRHHLHGSQARADRALHLRVRCATAFSHARPRAHRRTRAAPRRCASRAPSPPTTRPKNTWPMWRPCAKACGGRLLRSGAAPDLPHALLGQSLRSVRADAARQPQPLRVSDPVRRRATGGRVARDVRARGRRARRNLPHLRHRAAHRRSAAGREEHPRAAQLHQRRIRADHVHRRGSQR